jgi:hypothetical protein
MDIAKKIEHKSVSQNILAYRPLIITRSKIIFVFGMTNTFGF